jgi:hypothetical protein
MFWICRKWGNEEPHNVYFPSNIIRMKKLRKIRRAEYVAGMGKV